jgi:hypothetical protein
VLVISPAAKAKCSVRSVATGQIWVNLIGIHTVADLKGRFDRGTTAHNLHKRDRRDGFQQDVEIVNQHVELSLLHRRGKRLMWCRSACRLRRKAPKPRCCSTLQLRSATIVDGWAARNDFYENEGRPGRIIGAWVPANDYLIAN